MSSRAVVGRCRLSTQNAGAECCRPGCAQTQNSPGDCACLRELFRTQQKAPWAWRIAQTNCPRVSCCNPVGCPANFRRTRNTAGMGYQRAGKRLISAPAATGAPFLPGGTCRVWRARQRVGAKPDVVVRVATNVVQIQRPDASIAAVVPVAATDRTEHVKPPPHQRARARWIFPHRCEILSESTRRSSCQSRPHEPKS